MPFILILISGSPRNSTIGVAAFFVFFSFGSVFTFASSFVVFDSTCLVSSSLAGMFLVLSSFLLVCSSLVSLISFLDSCSFGVRVAAGATILESTFVELILFAFLELVLFFLIYGLVLTLEKSSSSSSSFSPFLVAFFSLF